MNATIVYQGVVGSNNEVASHQIVQEQQLDITSYIEGVSSQGVVDALKAGKAKYGVAATYNNLVGDVRETTLALDGLTYSVLATTTLHIHHALFTKHPDAVIETIASHPHALGQCAKYMADNYPDAKQVEISDTAIGAKHLASGQLSDTTAILCRQNAGLDWNLHMLSENVADSMENYTTFILFELI